MIFRSVLASAISLSLISSSVGERWVNAAPTPKEFASAVWQQQALAPKLWGDVSAQQAPRILVTQSIRHLSGEILDEADSVVRGATLIGIFANALLGMTASVLFHTNVSWKLWLGIPIAGYVYFLVLKGLFPSASSLESSSSRLVRLSMRAWLFVWGAFGYEWIHRLGFRNETKISLFFPYGIAAAGYAMTASWVEWHLLNPHYEVLISLAIIYFGALGAIVSTSLFSLLLFVVMHKPAWREEIRRFVFRYRVPSQSISYEGLQHWSAPESFQRQAQAIEPFLSLRNSEYFFQDAHSDEKIIYEIDVRYFPDEQAWHLEFREKRRFLGLLSWRGARSAQPHAFVSFRPNLAAPYNTLTILHSWTASSHRRRGLYTHAIRLLCSNVPRPALVHQFLNGESDLSDIFDELPEDLRMNDVTSQPFLGHQLIDGFRRKWKSFNHRRNPDDYFSDPQPYVAHELYKHLRTLLLSVPLQRRRGIIDRWTARLHTKRFGKAFQMSGVVYPRIYLDGANEMLLTGLLPAAMGPQIPAWQYSNSQQSVILQSYWDSQLPEKTVEHEAAYRRTESAFWLKFLNEFGVSTPVLMQQVGVGLRLQQWNYRLLDVYFQEARALSHHQPLTLETEDIYVKLLASVAARYSTAWGLQAGEETETALRAYWKRKFLQVNLGETVPDVIWKLLAPGPGSDKGVLLKLFSEYVDWFALKPMRWICLLGYVLPASSKAHAVLGRLIEDPEFYSRVTHKSNTRQETLRAIKAYGYGQYDMEYQLLMRPFYALISKLGIYALENVENTPKGVGWLEKLVRRMGFMSRKRNDKIVLQKA